MFRRILFPTDFSKGAERVIKNFMKRNKVRIGEMILLHVVSYDILDTLMEGKELLYESEKKEEEEIKEKLIKKGERKLNKVKNDISSIADKIITMVKIGIPYEEIIKTAEEENVSLILLPSHGKLGFSHEIFGSTTMRVLKKTKKPVLLIKATEE